MLGLTEVRDQIAEIPYGKDRKVADLLHDMGLDFVCSNAKLENYPEPIRGEVDLIFGTGDIMILVEVGAGRHAISEKKRKFFSKWKDGPNVEDLKTQYSLQYHKTIRVYFDLRPEPENPGLVELENIAEPGSMNKIYYEDDFNRLAGSVKRGDYTKNDFLADFAS